MIMKNCVHYFMLPVTINSRLPRNDIFMRSELYFVASSHHGTTAAFPT